MANTHEIERVLVAEFQPSYLDVLDESHQHAGHNPDARQGGTHFSLVIVSEKFKGVSTLLIHRMIFDCLKRNNISYHALSIRAKASA